MRIDTNLTKEDSDDVKELADQKGLQKTEAYTRAVKTGIAVEERREVIKDLIVRFMREEHANYDERVEALQKQYGIEKTERVGEGEFYIIHDGDKYDFNTPHELLMVNGESIHDSTCPDCGSDTLEFHYDNVDTDSPNYDCEDCGYSFDDPDRRGAPDEDAADQVKEFARRRQDLFDHVVGQLVELLDGVMGRYSSYSHGEWLGPGLYQYRNGFQTVTIPFWAEDPERIDFSVTRMMTDYESFRNPLYRAAKDRLTGDYLELVREVNAVNPEADAVDPIYLDRRGTMPEVIEVIGLDYDETQRPLRTVGYAIEKVAPEPEELQPEHDADDAVTWIRVTGDKPIEQEGEHTER